MRRLCMRVEVESGEKWRVGELNRLCLRYQMSSAAPDHDYLVVIDLSCFRCSDSALQLARTTYLLTRKPLTADKMVHKTMIKAKICILELVNCCKT